MKYLIGGIIVIGVIIGGIIWTFRDYFDSKGGFDV